MRIGEFWGLTAPMFLLAFPNVEDALNFLQNFNNKANQPMLDSLRIELCALRRVASLTKVKIKNEEELPSKVYPNLEWSGVSIAGTEDSILSIEYIQEVAKRVALQIIAGERDNHFVDCDVETLLHDIKMFLSQKNFMLMKTRSIVREFYKALPPGTKAIGNSLISKFDLECGLPDAVEFSGDLFELTPEMECVIRYFISRLNDIDLLIEKLSLQEQPEVTIFDIPFFDLMKRRPESLRYTVMNRFDVVKAQHNRAALENVLQDVLTNIDKYRKCMKQYIVPVGSYDLEQAELRKEYQNIFSQFSETKTAFFNSLITSGKMRLSDFLPSDLELLSELFDRIEVLNVDGLNKIFQINLNSVEWEKMSLALCGAWICGINLEATNLFADAITGCSMVHYKSEKPAEVLQEIDNILNDIDALISSIRPIGDIL